jgi:hypothetical protein
MVPIHTFTPRTCSCVAVTLALVVTSCSPSSPPPASVSETLLNVVRTAKANGRHSVDYVSTGNAPGVGRSLYAVSFHHSFLVAEYTGTSLVDASGTDLRTWHVFKLVDPGTDPPGPEPERCGWHKPARLQLAADQFAVPLVTGTMVIDGVKLNMTSADSLVSFAPAHRYLLVATRCDGQVVMLAFSKYSVLPLEQDGSTLVQPARDAEIASRPFMKDILDRRTVDSVLDEAKQATKR